MRKIQKMQMHEMAAEEIKRYITENDLQKGDKLPPLDQISEMLGVSRTSLREALRSLDAMDIIKIHNGKGVYVHDARAYHFSSKIDIEDEKTALLQTCQVRRALEGLAVELAAEKATPEDIADMLRFCDEIDRQQLPQSTLADLAFHQAIYRSAGNPILQSIVESVWEMFRKFWSYAPLGNSQLFADSFPFHRTLAEAIATGDKARAREEFEKLMDAIEEAIRREKK
ncbi:FadR/GntR family transcriptional regulator [Paenibacillus sp. MBLB4367]|uniref:FadR/GntR family transcriptional regulator n=1 Tax=Paenibacillus sp. MBLB4367 TaxID=3384767 RepID=UPI0039080D1D